jgi:hypothetical protein
MYDLDRLLESSDRVAVDILYYKLIDGYGKRSPVKSMFFDGRVRRHRQQRKPLTKRQHHKQQWRQQQQQQA